MATVAKHKQLIPAVLGMIALMCVFIAGMALAAQRMGAGPDAGAELRLAGTHSPAVAIAFTPTYTTYLPLTMHRILPAPNKFGTEIDSDFEDKKGARMIEQAGFGWYRHLQVDWADFEPAYGVYTMTPGGPGHWYDILDQGIARASASGLRPIIVIRDSPAWAPVGGKRGCDSVRPDRYAHLAAFVNKVVAKYEQPPFNTRYFELWNEPDWHTPATTWTEVGCWRKASDYVNMLKVVYPAVKAAHPGAVIMNGGLLELGPWAQTFISTGLNYIDVLAYHAYDTVDQGHSLWNNAADAFPSVYLSRLDTLRQWINLYNPARAGIDIFMDEGALRPGSGAPALDDLRRAQSYFAAFMAAQVTGEDLEQYSWYKSNDLENPITNTAYGLEVNQSYYVTNTLYTALAFGFERVYQATAVTTTRSSTGASIIKLSDANGQELWLMWNTNGSNSAPFTYTFTSTPGRVWDVWGGVLPVTTTLTMDDPHKVVWVLR